MHLEISSLAMNWCFRKRSAVLMRETILRGSPYSPMPVLVSRNVVANPAYSGLSRIRASKASSRCMIRSSFLLNSSKDLEELSFRSFIITALLVIRNYCGALPLKWLIVDLRRSKKLGLTLHVWLIVNFKTVNYTLMLL